MEPLHRKSPFFDDGSHWLDEKIDQSCRPNLGSTPLIYISSDSVDNHYQLDNLADQKLGNK